MDFAERLRALADCDSRAGDPLGRAMRDAADEIERLRAALTGIKRAGKARMASYGDEHSYYYFTASAALEQNKPEARISEQASEQPAQ